MLLIPSLSTRLTKALTFKAAHFAEAFERRSDIIF